MHPVKMMMESKLEVHKDKTLREATEMAYKVVFIHSLILQRHGLIVFTCTGKNQGERVVSSSKQNL